MRSRKGAPCARCSSSAAWRTARSSGWRRFEEGSRACRGIRRPRSPAAPCSAASSRRPRCARFQSQMPALLPSTARSKRSSLTRNAFSSASLVRSMRRESAMPPMTSVPAANISATSRIPCVRREASPSVLENATSSGVSRRLASSIRASSGSSEAPQIVARDDMRVEVLAAALSSAMCSSPSAQMPIARRMKLTSRKRRNSMIIPSTSSGSFLPARNPSRATARSGVLLQSSSRARRSPIGTEIACR